MPDHIADNLALLKEKLTYSINDGDNLLASINALGALIQFFQKSDLLDDINLLRSISNLYLTGC